MLSNRNGGGEWEKSQRGQCACLSGLVVGLCDMEMMDICTFGQYTIIGDNGMKKRKSLWDIVMLA